MAPTRFLAWLFATLLSAAAWAAPPPMLQEANQALKQGRHQLALDRVNAYLASNPKDAQGRFLKGLVLTELNRVDEAIRVFGELAQDYPELPEPHNNLAVLYAAQGQYEKAKASLETAIRTHPSYATAHENLGDIYAKLASQAYDRALQLDRSNRSAQMKLALVRELLAPPRAAETGKPKPTARPKAAAEPAASPTLALAGAEGPQPGLEPKLAGEVEKRLRAWAEAWSRRDPAAYLAFYAEDYSPPGKERAAWLEERKARLTRPSFIRVEVNNLVLKENAGRIEARFSQRYESNLLRETRDKTLVLERRGGEWLIVDER